MLLRQWKRVTRTTQQNLIHLTQEVKQKKTQINFVFKIWQFDVLSLL